MTENKNVPTKGKSGESSRIRTLSENSNASDEGAVGFTGKRQRTTSHQFMVASGLTAASPPKFVTLEEIMQAANGMRDMALVHHIAVDKDFKLTKVEPEPNTIHKAVKDTMHKAFWEILRSQLKESPPNYTQALNLLDEIKEGLFSVLLPQHTRIKAQISEILDTDLIRQQAENGTLDFPHYAEYVISVMAKLCAPVRDEKIKELSEQEDVVETFKGILETLELMRLDMANFTIQMAKPDIIAASVQLERKKFADYLKVQADGLQYTKNWLLKHVNTNQRVHVHVDYEQFIKNTVKSAFTQACVDLLDWSAEEEYPETFMLDVHRLTDLQVRTFRLLCTASVLLVTLSNAGPDLQTISSFKQNLKNHISILLENVKTEKDFIEELPNIAEQVVLDLKQAQIQYDLREMAASESTLKQQIEHIGKPDHQVRGIIKNRVKDFFLDIIESSTAAPQKVPSGLTALQKELTEIAGQFLRIVSHNNTVFSNYYYDIVAAALPKPA